MKSYVSLEKKICAICGHEHETNSILLDKRLKDSMEHYTVTGYDHCDDCKGKLDDDYIALVEIVNNPGKDKNVLRNEEAQRTGTIAWIRKPIAAQLFNRTITTPMAFVNHDIIEYLQSMASDNVQN